MTLVAHDSEPEIRLDSVLACPSCGHAARETMPESSCLFFYTCLGCGALLRPKAGDYCVFCSYGDVPCPPVQRARHANAAGCCPA